MNRFDIYGAIYILCTRWHSGQWSRGYRLLGKLHRAGYKPSSSVNNGSFESEDMRECYRRLLKYRHKL